jgi:hypothetical protein
VSFRDSDYIPELPQQVFDDHVLARLVAHWTCIGCYQLRVDTYEQMAREGVSSEVVYGGLGLADGSRLIQRTWTGSSIQLQSLRAKSGVSVLNLE